MAFFKAVSELSDVVSYAIYCPEDDTFMLTQESSSSEYWIPSTKITTGNSWQAQSLKDLQDIFGEVLNCDKILRLHKVWIPNYFIAYVYHCVYQVIVNQEKKKKSMKTYGKYRNKIKWVTQSELVGLLTHEDLKSPELFEMFMLLKGNQENSSTLLVNYENNLPEEYIYNGVLIEINDDVILSPGTNIYLQIIEAAAFTKEVRCNIYKEFILMCFPAIYMSLQVFSNLALILGWDKDDIVFLFRSADVSRRGGLSFRDFIYFLAATDPSTIHGGAPAELRCRYIFRFFDRDRDELINFDEFKNFVLYLRKSKEQTIDATSINQESQACFKSIEHSANNALTIVDFLHAVGSLQLRGTSKLYRSGISIRTYINALQEKESFASMTNETQITKNTENMDGGIKTYKPDYELAVHTVKLKKSGAMMNIDELSKFDAVTFSSTNQPTLNENNRKISIDYFSKKSVCNAVLKGLRYLTEVNKKEPRSAKNRKKSFTWGQLNSNQFGKNIMAVCSQTRDILNNESRLIELDSPVYVMGDLHGNFEDLLYFEKVFWHLGPGLSPGNLLFLGDYVDRGRFSVEVVTYLFCYKIQSPLKVNLLRGNHEIRDIQKMFTFYNECCNKFGNKMGPDVWNAVNNAFDTMPISCVIDGKVFCCHGGIPPPSLCPVVSAINSIPTPLSQPDEQSCLAWEIMWNDPVKPNQLTEAMTLELLENDGFAVNVRRGTAHVFSVEALERFLKVNGFSHLIRAHEVAEAGFNVQQRGKLLTVFSSSKYCGGHNEAACVLADQGKLRILQIETS